jgi:hypothetical protein
VGVVEMAIEDLLGEGEGAVEPGKGGFKSEKMAEKAENKGERTFDGQRRGCPRSAGS